MHPDPAEAHRRSRAGRSWRLVVAVLLPLVAWGVCVGLSWRAGLILTVTADSDGAAYMECAKSIAEGRGIEHTRGFDVLEDELWEPMRLWPPGYPAIVAPLVMLGVEPWRAGLAVAAASSAGFLVLLVLFGWRRLGVMPASLLATAVGVSRPFVAMSTTCLSDATYLLAAAGALMALGRVDSSRRPARWLMAAGVLAGVSWVTRNVGVAVVFATAGYFGVSLLFVPLWRVVRRSLIWSAGFLAVGAWLVARNFAVFGRLNPYTMGPSERGLWLNVTDTFATIGADLAGVYRAQDGWVAAAVMALLAIGAGVALWRWVRAGPARGAFLRARSTGVVLAIYACVYLGVLIGSRTVYHWGETINSRHIVQVDWIVWLLGVLGAVSLMRPAGEEAPRGTLARRAIPVVLTVLVVAQVRLTLATVGALGADRSRVIGPAKARAIGAMVGKNELVLTDRHAPLRLFASLFARQIPNPADGDPAVTEQALRQAGESGMLWGIVLVDPDEVAAGTFGEALAKLARDPDNAPLFERVEDAEGLLILRWVGPSK